MMSHEPDMPEMDPKPSVRWFPAMEAGSPIAHAGGSEVGAPRDASRRRRGRPLEMTRDEVLVQVRRLADRGALFKVHRSSPPLYARARRLFGTWAATVAAAGLDYRALVEHARRRSVTARQERRRSAP